MLKRFENLAIGQRLNIIVIVITVITLAVVVYIALFSTAEALGNNVENIAIDQNRIMAEEIDNSLVRVTQVLDAIATEISVDFDGEPLTIENFQATATKILEQENDILMRRIAVYVPGNPLALYNFLDPTSGRSILSNRFSESRLPEDYWLLDLIDNPVQGWIGPVTSAYLQIPEQNISFVVPYQPEGEVEGIIWADVFVNTLNQLLRDSSLMRQSSIVNDSGYFLITNNQGEVVTGSTPRDISEEEVTRAVTFSMSLTAGRLGEIVNERIVIIKSPIGETGLNFVSVIPSGAFNILPPSTVFEVVLISLLGLLFMTWAVNLVIQRTVVKPLNELGTAAMEIGSGDMRRVIEYQDHYDEIGQLSRTLEDMRNSLKYSYDTLEQRIERRTAELDLARAKAQSTAHELRAVYDSSLSVVSDYQLQSILDTFIRRIVTLMDSDYCSVWLLRSNGHEIRRVAQVHGLVVTSNSDMENVPIIEIGQGMVGITIQTGQPMIIDQYSKWEYRLQPAVTDNIERVLCVPLLFSGQAIGAVMTARHEDGTPFTESDQRLLALFANLVSPSVRNAQLIVQIEAARKEADRANMVKTRFLASVTHELRTPLNLIINNMDFMRVGTFGPVTEDQENRLDQTIRSAEHLLYLINDLLDVSKIDAGEMQLFIQPTDITPIVEDALDSALMIIEKEKKSETVMLNVEIDDNIPAIPMDARRVRQVLTNLLSNAVKFTLEGTVHLHVNLKDDHLLFKVRDTGIGIPEAEKDKLFQPFERTNTAKSMGIEGTGLGLQICKHLVEQHGGHIWFDSKQDIGTTFFFTLPLSENEDIRSSRTQLMQVYLDEDFAEAETEEISIDHHFE